MHTSLITAALRPTIQQQQQQQHHLHPSSSSTGGPCIPSSAPRYLSDFLRRVADLPSRRRLWSATSNQLDVRPSRLVTVGDRSFGSVGPKLWNSLPDDITSASSLRPFIWLCWAKALEQSPWWHYIGFIAVSFQKEIENSLISAILSGHYFVVCYGFLTPSRSLKLFVT